MRRRDWLFELICALAVIVFAAGLAAIWWHDESLKSQCRDRGGLVVDADHGEGWSCERR